MVQSISRNIYESLSKAARGRLWLLREGYAMPQGRRPKIRDGLVTLDWDGLTAVGKRVAAHCKREDWSA